MSAPDPKRCLGCGCGPVPAGGYDGCESWSSMVALEDIRRLAMTIARQFRPQRIVLFGSYAYGCPTEDSDVDLLVVLPFEGRALAKGVEILSRANPPFPVDLIARRPDDCQRRFAEGDPLIREAFERGMVLYERDG